MSLLRDALKKAERAQEEARRQAGAQPLALEPAPLVEPVPLQAEPQASVPIEAISIEAISIEAISIEASAPEGEGPAAQPGVTESVSAQTASESRFESREPNPRRPFHLALAALGLLAAGTVGHFWLQLRPASPVAHSAPSRPAMHGGAVQPKPAAAEPLLATTEEALASLPRPATVASETDGRARRESAPATATAPKAEPIVLPRPSGTVHRSAGASVPVRLESDDPGNLKTIPGDPQTSAADHLALGNQHARNGRWRDAQREFAAAIARDPADPDLAFNLAVSHDRLREQREAIAHYEHALRLRQGRPAHFPADAARERMRYLARSP